EEGGVTRQTEAHAAPLAKAWKQPEWFRCTSSYRIDPIPAWAKARSASRSRFRSRVAPSQPRSLTLVLTCRPWGRFLRWPPKVDYPLGTSLRSVYVGNRRLGYVRELRGIQRLLCNPIVYLLRSIHKSR